MTVETLLTDIVVLLGVWGGSWVLPAGGFGVGLAALAVYPTWILRRYIRIMIKLIDEQAPVLDTDPRAVNGLGGQEVRFRATDGHPLRGVILSGDPDRPCRGMVVFAHEFDSDRSSCLRYCRFLLDEGYDVFAFDFRGHGLSPGEPGYKPRQWPSDRETADMRGAIVFICNTLARRGRPREIALFGVSRGGGAAILASRGADCVRAIVTDGAFSSDSMLEYLMKRFATIFARIRVVAENHPPTFWRFLRWLLFRECRRRFNCEFPSVRKAVRKLRRTPTFFIHGQKDSYVPITQSQLLYDNARGPKQLWIVPNAKHNLGIVAQPDAYQKNVMGFLDEHLSRTPQPVAPPRVAPRAGLRRPTPAVPTRPSTPRPAAVHQDSQV